MRLFFLKKKEQSILGLKRQFEKALSFSNLDSFMKTKWNRVDLFILTYFHSHITISSILAFTK